MRELGISGVPKRRKGLPNRWLVDAKPTAGTLNTALAMAINARNPTPGMVVHADHGPQYTSGAFSSQLRSAGLVQSLGTVGDAYDNAMVESLWGRMQTELLNTNKWSTRSELSTASLDWIKEARTIEPVDIQPSQTSLRSNSNPDTTT